MNRFALMLAIAMATIVFCTPGRTARGADKSAAPVASVPAAQGLNWSLQLPADEKVPFSGVANFDGSGMSTGSMMYPAPNAIGLLAAVLTHAAIMKSTRNAQKTKIQKDADKVLGPYQPVLDGFHTNALMERGLSLTSSGTARQLLQEGQDDHQGWLVLSTPSYAMTQDQSTLVLDNIVEIYAPNERKKASYVNTVRVISSARQEQDMMTYWTRDQGNPLKEESARLLAASLDIAIADASRAKADAPFKTVRYQEGHAERMERGQLIDEQCGRVLLRSLRGTLMSAPAKMDETAAPSPTCGDQTANAAQSL
ncbi:hypothetical protein [Dyella japonica]|uniref:Lipoprotein n=1 Tax=Dyella japonica A8 TaxID=1217721 RepID=A0A075K0B8_9GAMM|nr:hypothetical protein [Dyella japonica]AIF47594.1 hypothetical protein HY57_10105 [Dyella japonica A8]